MSEDKRFVWKWVVAVLVITQLITLGSLIHIRNKYSRSVLCSACEGVMIVGLLRNSELGATNDLANRKITTLVSVMREFGMNDQKSAIVLFDAMKHFPDCFGTLPPEDSAYVSLMKKKWHGKDLGYVNSW